MSTEKSDISTSVRSRIDAIRARVETVIVGKRDIVNHALCAILTNGHILIEDTPGVGKTTLAKALATALGCDIRRIQFTPDLLPADVTGSSIFNSTSRDFEFRPGPVFTQVLLADEINRATPKTQAALLECMEERQVTVDGITYPVPAPFFVIATQNPVDQHGTYPLPEAQLDRFAMKLSVGYPAADDEVRMLQDAVGTSRSTDGDQPVLELQQLSRIQESVKGLSVAASVQDYLVRLAHETRCHPSIALGLSPRGLLSWQRVAQSRAWLLGRNFVTPDDVQESAVPVLSVRIGLDPVEAGAVNQEILERVPVPESLG